MTFVLAACVTVCFAVSIYLLLGRDLKGVAMGVFLLGHAANLSIIAMSGSPVIPGSDPVDVKDAPLLGHHPHLPILEHTVDPLPQALILTAIVIGFAVMGFLLTLLIITSRATGTLQVDALAKETVPAAAPPPAEAWA